MKKKRKEGNEVRLPYKQSSESDWPSQ
jgi:hypothetical protein